MNVPDVCWFNDSKVHTSLPSLAPPATNLSRSLSPRPYVSSNILSVFLFGSSCKPEHLEHPRWTGETFEKRPGYDRARGGLIWGLRCSVYAGALITFSILKQSVLSLGALCVLCKTRYSRRSSAPATLFYSFLSAVGHFRYSSILGTFGTRANATGK